MIDGYDCYVVMWLATTPKLRLPCVRRRTGPGRRRPWAQIKPMKDEKKQANVRQTHFYWLVMLVAVVRQTFDTVVCTLKQSEL